MTKNEHISSTPGGVSTAGIQQLLGMQIIYSGMYPRPHLILHHYVVLVPRVAGVMNVKKSVAVRIGRRWCSRCLIARFGIWLRMVIQKICGKKRITNF